MSVLQKLGTLTIKGFLPSDLAGNASNFEKTYRFTLTTHGYVRARKLYKTFDPSVVISASGLVNATIVSQSFSVN